MAAVFEVEGEEVENPVAEGRVSVSSKDEGQSAGADAANSLADVEAAMSSLRDIDQWGGGETAEVVERLLCAREAALRAEIRAEFEQGAPVRTAARSGVAQVKTWSQATVNFAAGPAHLQKQWQVPSALGSALIVLVQTVVVVGALAGAFLPPCEVSDQCANGRYCTVGSGHQCKFCGSLETIDISNRTTVKETCFARLPRSPGEQPRIRSDALVSWCETCVRAIDGTVDKLTSAELARDYVDAMSPFDWVTLICASVVFALTVGSELKDIKLCHAAIGQAADRITRSWQLVLLLILGFRRWVFLPGMVATAPTLVLLRGGDGLSICANTVAVIFLCQINSASYSILLSDTILQEVEQGGQVVLDEGQAQALQRSKAAHVVMLALFVPLAVWLGASGDASGLWLGPVLPFVAFLCAGFTDVVGREGGAKEAAKGGVQVAWMWAFGLVAWAVLFFAGIFAYSL